MLYYVENRNVPLSASYFSGLTTLPHIHPHLELIYLTEGECVAIADNKEFYLEKGDLFLAFPNQIHSYKTILPVKGHLIIFSPELFKDFQKIFEKKIPIESVVKKTQMNSDTKEMLDKIVERTNAASSFAKIAAKGYLLTFLAEFLPLMRLNDAPVNHDSLKEILNYCAQNYTETLTLDKIAAEVHLNKYYISHILKERLNMSFTDFVNGMRIEHASGMLGKSANITEIAFSSGFSSVRTFNRVFMEKMKMTPRDYIKMKEEV